eukprot:2185904-Ditylum_brightwellii.AAC.1
MNNVPEGTEVRCPPYFCLDELKTLSKEHWLLTDRVTKFSSLQHLPIGDVKHIKSSRLSLSKMRLVVEEIKRLYAPAGINTNSRTPVCYLPHLSAHTSSTRSM